MAYEAQREQLIKRLQELGVRLSKIDTELTQPHEKDWEDMAIEVEGEEVLEKLGESSQG